MSRKYCVYGYDAAGKYIVRYIKASDSHDAMLKFYAQTGVLAENAEPENNGSQRHDNYDRD